MTGYWENMGNLIKFPSPYQVLPQTHDCIIFVLPTTVVRVKDQLLGCKIVMSKYFKRQDAISSDPLPVTVSGQISMLAVLSPQLCMPIL